MRKLGVLILGIAISSAACGSPAPDTPRAEAPRPTVTTEGSVTTVSNRDAPAWGGAGELIEEASIGVPSGDEAYLLGGVTSIAASEDTIFVCDHQAVTVRVYDWEGRHLREIGTRGSGPGEFRRPMDIAFTADGELLVRDLAQRRLHIFTPQGELLGDWEAERGLRTTIADDGSVYVIREAFLPNAGGEMPVDVMRHDPQGAPSEWRPFPRLGSSPIIENGNAVEMLAVFLGFESDWRNVRFVPFAPRVVTEVGPDGSMISGRADSYSFQIQRGDGSTLVVEKEWSPVPMDDGEADWYRRRHIALFRAATDPSWAWEGDDIPDHKGAFVWIIPAHDRYTWVIRELAGEPIEGCNADPEDYAGYVESPCWSQPHVADVFDEEGVFQGSVPMPDGIQYHVRPYIDDDVVIALSEDIAGTAYVKRYRVQSPR